MTSDAGGTVRGSGGFAGLISGRMRFHETSAFCTELKSLATLEDLTVSLVKQERKVVNAAMSHAAPPCAQDIFARRTTK